MASPDVNLHHDLALKYSVALCLLLALGLGVRLLLATDYPLVLILAVAHLGLGLLLYRMVRAGHYPHLDHLTGLLNRRGIEARLDVELQRQRRTGSPLALLVLGIDNFKRVNDRYGHAIGDRCLVALAKCLQRSTRGGDLVARFGARSFCWCCWWCCWMCCLNRRWRWQKSCGASARGTIV